MPRRDAERVAHDWVSAWLDGAVGPGEWEALTGGGASDGPLRTMHLVWDALVEDGLGPHEISRSADGRATERWAWSPRWILMSQDEDLMLFGQARSLLELAADRSCPKWAYMIEIAAHDLRDQAHAFVTHGTRNDSNESPLTLAAQLAPLARRAGAPEVAAYFERLASYALPSKVDRDAVLQRAMDLHRCAPPQPEEVDVRVDGDGWRVTYRARFGPETGFVVARKTGALRRGQ